MFKKIVIAAALMVCAAFAQIDVGAHAAFSYGSAWGKNTDELDWGPGFIVGPEVKYSINPMLSMISGLELDYRRMYRDFHVEYDALRNPDLRDYTVDETYSFMYLDIPVLLRVNPVSFFFIDAGVTFGFNLSASFTEEDPENSESNDISSKTKLFELGLDCGLGFMLFSELELNFRAAFGLIGMAKKSGDSKNLRLLFGISYWTF